MKDLYARAVFFVRDAGQALTHYTERLGFSLDWTYEEMGRPLVFQVSLLGFELILNQAESWTQARAGQGRVFIGLDEEQSARLLQHIEDTSIETSDFHWGAPTLVIRDRDGNELFFWLPQAESEG